ncbi:MAG: hypothetical protein HPY50_04860 [Firmicutes bacterium]|nr:hypothetical protein [Bacillota bacterium]
MEYVAHNGLEYLRIPVIWFCRLTRIWDLKGVRDRPQRPVPVIGRAGLDWPVFINRINPLDPFIQGFLLRIPPMITKNLNQPFWVVARIMFASSGVIHCLVTAF